MDTILVTGGTGVLGARVVRRLAADGRAARVFSRRPRRPGAAPDAAEWAVGDLTTGDGLEAALDGVTAVINCASDARRHETDVTAARRLAEAVRRSGEPHVVHISIAGIDRVPLGYYRSKLRAERVLEESGVPLTVLRATQFHDLVLAVAQQLTRLPAALVPSGAWTQPVDVGEVADRLAGLAATGPAGRVPDMGGPAPLTLADAARALLRVRGVRRPVVTVPFPGRVMAAVRAGGLLTPDGATGRIGFDDFLSTAPLTDRTYGAAQRHAED